MQHHGNEDALERVLEQPREYDGREYDEDEVGPVLVACQEQGNVPHRPDDAQDEAGGHRGARAQ